MIKDLKQEIERLKQQLEAGLAGGGGLGGSTKGHDPEVERRLREMEEVTMAPLGPVRIYTLLVLFLYIDSYQSNHSCLVY